MIAASGPPARQPLLGDGNHLIESLLGPRCERIVTCSRHGKVFPLRADFLRDSRQCEKLPVSTTRPTTTRETIGPGGSLIDCNGHEARGDAEKSSLTRTDGGRAARRIWRSGHHVTGHLYGRQTLSGSHLCEQSQVRRELQRFEACGIGHRFCAGLAFLRQSVIRLLSLSITVSLVGSLPSLSKPQGSKRSILILVWGLHDNCRLGTDHFHIPRKRTTTFERIGSNYAEILVLLNPLTLTQ
ncbi:uncharacterized protein LOC144467645 [Augochlora pura]